MCISRADEDNNDLIISEKEAWVRFFDLKLGFICFFKFCLFFLLKALKPFLNAKFGY